METGKIQSFEEVRRYIEKGDVDVTVKAGIVVTGNMGSLIALRESLKEHVEKCNGELVYFTITAQPVYIVHWNDLSPEKQASLEKRRGGKKSDG